MQFLFRYANPHNFMRLSGAVLPFTAIGAALALIAGLYFAFSVPPDYQQGTTVKILFIHVPAAIMAMVAYSSIAVCSLLSLVWRHPLSDTAARACAPLGAMFTVMGLITGALWGKPMWGTYWVWDARLTSFLLLLFIYLGYMALWSAIEDEIKAARAAAILALVGAVNIPIIKFSVEWWNTLHQGETITTGKLAAVYVPALLTMMLAYFLLFLTLWMIRIRTAIVERRARNLMQGAAS
ncbi:MAG: heme ABC transporter permease [Pseudomonadota bacterium]